MKSLIARFRRWLHCLTHLHCSITISMGYKVLGIYIPLKTTFIGCECGKEWLNTTGFKIPEMWNLKHLNQASKGE